MATTYDKASLVMIPSGVKEDKLYSIKPTDGSGDFTFSRGSDIQATRVNSSGLIEKAKVNNILYSNDFSNAAWTNASSSETSGQSGYDGSSDAWLLTSSLSGGRISQSVSVSGVQTFSVYLKAGSRNWALLVSTATSAYFDLANGVVGSGGTAPIDANIESVGGGWYRCSITASGSNTEVRIYPALDDNDVSGTGSIYIQDAAICHGLIAQDYVETTTTAVVEGLTADLPRLDYSGGASCPSLLLEPSRTNLIPQSEYASTSTFILVNGGYTWTHNDVTSPEGVQNATKWAAAGTSAVVGVYRNISVTSGLSYSFSIFAKAGDHSFIQLQNGGTGSKSNTYANFDLTNGTKSNGADVDDSIMEPFGNGWYRCGITFSVTSTGTSNVSIDIIDDLTATRNGTFTGSVGDYFYAWGLQAEEASYPTSYIPTYGASAQRATDVATGDITSVLTSNEGTLFIHLNDGANSRGWGSGVMSIGLTDSGYNNAIGWASNSPAATELRGIYRVGNVQTYLGVSTPINTECKILIKWGNGTAKFFKNGSLHDSSSVTDFTGQPLEDFELPRSARYGDFPTKQTLVFPTALTDAECIALTTL